MRRGLLVIGLCIIAFTAGSLLATQDYMTNQLPWCTNYRCAVCHTSSNPTVGSSELNNFGSDFVKNGKQWNAALAAKDSDNDGYPNGIELGDNDGNGMPEVAVERSNPGDPHNYPSSIDPETWSVIKNLFAAR
jgi:hypothetical protein